MSEGAAQKFDLAAIEALEKLEKAASEGPWEDGHPGIDQSVSPWNPVVALTTVGPPYMTYEKLVMAPADAAFMIALRNAAPSLLALAREALAAREWIKAKKVVFDWPEHEMDQVAFEDALTARTAARLALVDLVAKHQSAGGGDEL